jgi:hypothetical protein
MEQCFPSDPPDLMGHVREELRFTTVCELGGFPGGSVLLDAVAQIEDHLIDLCFQRVHFATGFDGDEACEISIHCGCGYLSEPTDLRGQIASHGIDRHPFGMTSGHLDPKRGEMTYVISCQIPWTLPTSAWTPSLPSVPTSRATFLTSEAKNPSWSIMSLIVFTRSRISPETETPVTFWVKSPRATAVCKNVLLSLVASRAKRYTYRSHGDSSDL